MEWLAASAAGVLVRALSLEEAQDLGALMGRVAFTLLGARRRLALENIERVYGTSLPEEERRSLARRVFEHYGRVLAEVMRFPLVRAENYGRLLEIENLGLLRSAAAQGRGVIVVAAHFGNWELAGLAQGFAGFPMTMLTRPLDNPLLEGMLARYRTRSGNRILHKSESLRALLGVLRAGGIAVVVMDQHFHGPNAVWSPFMGRLAATTPAVALLALRTGTPVVMAFPLQEGRRWRLVYEKGPDIAPSGSRERDIVAFTMALNARLEHYVRLHPQQWLWMHKRWRAPKPQLLKKSSYPVVWEETANAA